MLRPLTVALAFLASLSGALADSPRFALVVGTGPEGALGTAASANAGTVAVALRDAGFDVENPADLDAPGLRRAVREFTARVEAARGEAYAVLYLGGPVLQLGGGNFLMTRGSDIRRAGDVPIEGVAIGDLLRSIATAPAKGRLLIADAIQGPGIDGVSPGLADLSPAKGTFVAMSAAPGETLPTGDAAPRFSEAVAESLGSGAFDVEAVFERVHNQVGSKSGGKQSPTRMGALVEPFPIGAKPSGKQQPAASTVAEAAPVADGPIPSDAAGDQPPASANASDLPRETGSVAAPPEPAAGPVASASAAPPGSPAGGTSPPEPEAATNAQSASAPAAAATSPPDTMPVPPEKPKAPPRMASVQPPPGAEGLPGADAGPGAAPPGAADQPPITADYLAYLRPRDAYRLVTQTATAQAYNAFLRAYPDHPLAADVRTRLAQQQDVVAWRRAVSVGTSGAYRTYLRSFPSGRFRVQAEARLGRPAAAAQPPAAIPPRPMTPSPFSRGPYGGPPDPGGWR